MDSTAHGKPVHWPSVGEFLAIKRTGRINIGRYVKVRWLLWHTRSLRKYVDRAAWEEPLARALLHANPKFYRALFEQFFDSRLTTASRFKAIASDLKGMAPRIARGFPEFFSDFRAQTLWSDAELGYSLHLSANDHTPQEGLWSLSLIDERGDNIYRAAFSVVDDTLFIGAVQGPSNRDLASLQIREATKRLHGLRPHFFVAEALRILARAWELSALCGIDPNHQLKASPQSSDHQLVKFDYRSFWAELGGDLASDGYWHLPLVKPDRDLQTVESKKRAMYRRRAALMQAVEAAIEQRWAAH